MREVGRERKNEYELKWLFGVPGVVIALQCGERKQAPPPAYSVGFIWRRGIRSSAVTFSSCPRISLLPP
jgi:hypothetical protein